jgi:autotransporter passenger strand-loop-strand repeat protein
MGNPYSGTVTGTTQVHLTVDDGDGDSDLYDVGVTAPVQFDLTVNSDFSVSGTATCTATVKASDFDPDDPTVFPGSPQTSNITGTTSNIDVFFDNGTVRISFTGFLSKDQTTIVGSAKVDVYGAGVAGIPEVVETLPVVLTLPALTGNFVAAGQTVYLPFGAFAGDVTIQNGGTLINEGKLNNPHVQNGGHLVAGTGGINDPPIISAGGLETINSGGTDLGALLSGGRQDVFGNASGVQVNSGGVQVVFSGGVASGTTVRSGGVESVNSGGTTSAMTIAGGTLTLASGANSDVVTFQGGGGLLNLALSAAPGTIGGLVTNDQIQVSQFQAGSALIHGTTLTVTGTNGQVLTYQLANPDPDIRFVIRTFSLHTAGGGGTVNTNLLASNLQTLTSDFTGGGVSDLLWRNISGEVDTWLMTSGRLTGGSVPGNVATTWRFAGIGDFTGNGTSDAAWQNTATGEVDTWLFANGQVTGGTAIGRASSVWQPLGTGDFNHDGVSDLLWRNGTTGEIDAWFMNNGQVGGGAVFGSVSSAWQFAGVGDFNGDGTSDFLWHNTNTGVVDAWIVNNGHALGDDVIGQVSSAWQCLGTGDFNGDGTSDVLWRNTSTGEVDTWLMSNGRVIGGAALGSVSTAWQFAGTGEYTGNGTSDIVWRNTATGEVDTWLITNDQLTGGTAIGTASTAWQLQVIGTG